MSVLIRVFYGELKKNGFYGLILYSNLLVRKIILPKTIKFYNDFAKFEFPGAISPIHLPRERRCKKKKNPEYNISNVGVRKPVPGGFNHGGYHSP